MNQFDPNAFFKEELAEYVTSKGITDYKFRKNAKAINQLVARNCRVKLTACLTKAFNEFRVDPENPDRMADTIYWNACLTLFLSSVRM